MRRSNTIASFLDIMFNILMGFFILLMISVVLINPVKKNKDVELKAEIIITMEWDEGSKDDIDLFVQHPNNTIVYYGNKDGKTISLDRDDMGLRNDTVIMPDGTRHVVTQNWENVMIRKKVPGEYIVNVYTFRKREVSPTSIRVKVEQLNPYKTIYAKTVVTTQTKEEFTIVRFTINSDGKINDLSELEESLVNKVKRR